MSSRILVVDDESAVRRLLRRCFEGAGYDVVEADSGISVFEQLDCVKDIHLITLDIGLGVQDGLDVARQVRAKHDIPIIMVTGKGDLIDTVVGLEVGADDYISKPFELREVLARVKAVLRRYEGSKASLTTQPEYDGASKTSELGQSSAVGSEATLSSERYRFGEWSLNTTSRELYGADNTLCELTTAEFELLKLFVTHPRKVLTRDQIMDKIKGGDWLPTDRTIDNQVSRLRKKIQIDGQATQLIKTIRGAGYMFNAHVERM